MRLKNSIAVASVLAILLLVVAFFRQEKASGQKMTAPPTSITLDPSRGQEIGAVYEAFLSPHQQPDEEANTPAIVPKNVRATAPSVPRKERKSRGHGILRFTKDLSKAFVEVKIENIRPEDIVLFHIHAGRPDQLGPVLVDLALSGDLREQFADGLFTAELTNENIEKTLAGAHGLMGGFNVGVPIVPGLPDKVKTIGGMAFIAQNGELYFNLHTKGQTFYGDIRGQLRPVSQ